MSIPKPSETSLAKTPAELIEDASPEKVESKKSLKKPFVRKPHLTDRALKNHPGLIELKKQITPRTGKK